MTQQFPLLFAPFRLGKHDLQSRICFRRGEKES